VYFTAWPFSKLQVLHWPVARAVDFRGVATLKLLDVSFGPSWDIERSVVSCGWDKTQEKVDVEFTLEVTEKWGVFGIGPWSSQFSFSQYSMGKGTASHLGPCCCKEE
jgi:hypothetical protein